MHVSSESQPEAVRSYIYTLAETEGIDAKRATDIAGCESRYNPKAVGDKKTSFGIYQLHLPDHPTVTEEQAESLIWSTVYALNEMQQGHWSMWSCDRMTTR